VTALSWVVAICFILATALLLIDRLNLVATPPAVPDSANMIDRVLGSVDYRQAIWPVFLWTNLLFGVGFIAAVPFAAVVASRIAGGLPAFVALTAVGGTIAAIASLIPIGAVNAAVWLQYCDCGFKETEIISQQWAGMVAFDIGDWFNRVGSVVLAVALAMLVWEAAGRIGSALRTWTILTAIALAALPVMSTIGRLGDVPDYLAAIIGAVLVPVWAIWLGRSIEDGAEGSAA